MNKHFLDDYRSRPFYSINGKLDKKILGKQIAYFKEMGFGGFFFHSRAGLKTEYLGEEWFDTIKFCAEQAAELGLEFYLYDEDRYPSGTCAGYVTQNPEFAEKYIFLDICDNFDQSDYSSKNIIAVFDAVLDGEFLVSYSLLRGKPKGKVLVFYWDYGISSSTYNGFYYIDVLNRAATERFLQLTHEKYKEKCGSEFGKKIYGIFTDEFHWGALFTKELKTENISVRKVPFTYSLFDNFEKNYGYRLQDCLPELFFIKKGRNIRRIAWQFVELIQQMILNNFVKPYYEWCQKNKLIFTGHILSEDTLSTQSLQCGSVMRYYEYMTYPGVDLLCEYPLRGWVMKQLSSVSVQQGKEFSVSECFGATGYTMNFERYKYLIDFQAVFGINFFVPHLSWYTMEGYGKRDYPTSIFYQSCWYKDWAYMEKYISVLNSYSVRGNPIADVCVINPVESAWSLLRMGCSETESFYAVSEDFKKLEDNYQSTFTALALSGVEFDYLDEDHLMRFYKIVKENGKTLLCIGNACYQTAVIADNIEIRKSTFDILKEFADTGGKVIVNPENLRYVDFMPLNSVPSEFITLRPTDKLSDCVKKHTDRLLSVQYGLYHSLRKADNGYYVFLTNPDRVRGCKRKTLTFFKVGTVREIDILSGREESLATSIKDNSTSVELNFHKGESKLLFFEEKKIRNRRRKKQKYVYTGDTVIPDKMVYSLSEKNVMVLDHASYCVDGISYEEDYVLNIDDNLRDRLGFERRYEMAVQPWYKEKYNKDYGKTGCSLRLDFSFDVKNKPENLYLCVENSKYWEIFINGARVSKRKYGLWVDYCFDKLKIDVNYLTKGKNVITIKGQFNEKKEIEAIYLVGDFGVSADGRSIIGLPNKLRIGDISSQGLPFYSGKITYFTGIKDKSVTFKFNEANGAVQSVIADGKKVMLPFAPYQSDILNIKDSLNIEISLTRHNTFGAIHNKTENIEWNGFDSFKDLKDGNFSRDFIFKKQGLLSKPSVKEYRKIKSEKNI